MNPFNDSVFVGTPWSKWSLDDEARQMATRRALPGRLCCRRIRVLMIAPKTHTLPPRNGCCQVEVAVYWSPYDTVPNQTPFDFGPRQSNNYWSQWGNVYAVDPGRLFFGNHGFHWFLNNPITLVPNPNPPSITSGQGAGAAALIRPQ